MNLPKIAYVLLWFPLSSETFIFREVRALRRLGLHVLAYSLYGKKLRNLSPEMIDYSYGVRRMGLFALPLILRDVLWWNKRRPGVFRDLARRMLLRRWCSLEVTAESLWAFLAGFRLARLLQRDAVDHIHAPWAGGPATAAWVASQLTGVPYSMAGRAGDIYPPDGALAEKIRDALFVRVNNLANKGYLASQAPGHEDKIHLVYNSLTFRDHGLAAADMTPPCKLLAVGRFARTKGFDVLLRACALLKRQGFPFRLTLVGSGFQDPLLKALRKRLGLEDAVCMPGFLSHDETAWLMASQDIMVVPSVVHASGDRDGIPNVIMEALSRRLPVVATDVCGIPEVIRHGETGLIAPQRDPEGLAEAIRAMAADRDGALAMAEAGQRLVREMFDPEVNAHSLYELFRAHTSPPAGQEP
ncbi:N-acetyl-alpha-D-glucosaminyl L-malate synthase [Fundidesulfovibrio magnetotacticus]|uniref:N-acetyl-alpha-D-glucosaminyl L-malate synthase n=1 Tax=Fundidesulfovibrio magnetotacticus TaxID=2730080 RepID=A0A6V8M5V6_9BACT|nr:glycosyltransferase family 4 protein [Fundidesulfovibrio magnetotacticus]GFK95975.1 N-acetyl-alpha-D-glucosaminyl L-malate synthase [Fundidesulfovibrio magnetotacticus]